MNKDSKEIIKSTDKLMRGLVTLSVVTTIGAASFVTYSLGAQPVKAKEVIEISDAETRKLALAEKVLVLKTYTPETQISSVTVEAPPTFKTINGDLTTYNLTQHSYLTAEQIDQMLAGTGLEGLGWAYVEAEKRYNVNALYLVAHSALESGWGDSAIANLKNNLFGFQAYDASPTESARAFNSKADCILIVANYIANEYLTQTGQHYNGSTLSGMGIKYASDDNWAIKIASIMNRLQGEVGKV